MTHPIDNGTRVWWLPYPGSKPVQATVNGQLLGNPLKYDLEFPGEPHKEFNVHESAVTPMEAWE